jgi:4-hydroxybenzoate polyprenyltransferase
MSRVRSNSVHADVPLVVDVDGTLVKTDLLHESLMQLVATRPLYTLRLPGWLGQGRATLKRQLTHLVDPHIRTLPLRAEVVALIREAQAKNRPVYLASASDRIQVSSLAEQIGGIAGVFATDGEINLAGDRKAAALTAAFGLQGFDYIGDRKVDFPVWAQARRVLAVTHNSTFERSVKKRFPEAQIVIRAQTRARSLIRALRPHQWAKNLLLFLPLIVGHLFDPRNIGTTALAFVCFCMAASSAYILNDLLDLPGDRVHPDKQRRPFAAGDVSISFGLLFSALLFIAAAAVSLLLPWGFTALLGLYVLTTLAYSLVLKRKLFVDVITLGGLYTIRVMAGLEASHIEQSHWLLMICLFLFMCLATVKRCSELVRAEKEGGVRTVGRGYQVRDLPIIGSLGAAAGYATSLVLALYISSPEVAKLYRNPPILWLVEPLFLYWISRILIMAHRGRVNEDPVIFAFTDKVSLITGACIAAVVGVAF